METVKNYNSICNYSCVRDFYSKTLPRQERVPLVYASKLYMQVSWNDHFFTKCVYIPLI